MKRLIYIFIMIIVCFVLQTTIFTHFKFINIIPNFMVILTAASGFMFGRKYGMYTGFLCGFLLDCLFGEVIGVCIFIYVVVGYINGMANKLYYKDDLSIPIIAIALSDLIYSNLYFVCFFLLRGRFNIMSFFVDIMLPEMIYTVIMGIIIYKFIYWLDDKLYPEIDAPISEKKTDIPL